MPLHKWDTMKDKINWIELGQIGNVTTDGNVAIKIFEDTVADYRQKGNNDGYRLRGLRNDGTYTIIRTVPMITPTGDKIDLPEDIKEGTTETNDDWKYILVIIVFIIIVLIYLYLKKSGHIK